MALPSPVVVRVRDGAGIATYRRPGASPTVVAVHGLSANAVAWQPLLDALPDRDVVLVDLRGRGASTTTPPYGMEQHAEDLATVVTALELGPVVVVGHSMGAYVATQLAVRHPDVVAGLVLVDGGITYDVPAGTDLQALLETVLSPVVAKLQKTWGSPEEYLAFWEQVPAFAGVLAEPAVEAYLRSDLRQGPSGWVATADEAAVRSDYAAMCEPHLKTDLGSVRCPVQVVRAEHGLLASADAPDVPILSDPLVAELQALVPQAVVRTAAGTNHYTVTLTPAGATAVAAAVRDLL